MSPQPPSYGHPLKPRQLDHPKDHTVLKQSSCFAYKHHALQMEQALCFCSCCSCCCCCLNILSLVEKFPEPPHTGEKYTGFSVGKAFVLPPSHQFHNGWQENQQATLLLPEVPSQRPLTHLTSSRHSSSFNQAQRHQAHTAVRAGFLPCMLLVLPV